MSKFIDLKNKSFGYLEVITQDYERNEINKARIKKGEIKSAKTYWLCKCNYQDCNNVTSVQGYDLTHNIINKCNKHQYDSHMNSYDLSGECGIGYTSNTNKIFYFDLVDYDKIKNYYWAESNGGYISCLRHINNKKKMILMHRLVLDVVDGGNVIDHIDGERNDNRKINLRKTSYTRNSQNRVKIASNNITGFTGVKLTKDNTYRSYITVNGCSIDLGTHETFEEAVRVRVKAEIKYFGEFSPLT